MRAELNNGHFVFQCPGCGFKHAIPVIKNSAANPWAWNGDLDFPSIHPSILVRGEEPVTEEEVERILRGEPIDRRPLLCHSFIESGKIRFLGDCTHKLAGQVIDLPEWIQQ